MIGIEKPSITSADMSEDGSHGRFVLEPLERGYGTTLGNSLRRVLLSSLTGYAITSVKIDGVLHEFSTIEGVKEDVTEIVLNLKNVILKIGKRGCLVKNAHEQFITPCYPRATVVDTTGAGDNFASGFLSFIMEGKSLLEASRFANCTASLAIEKVGATAGVGSRAQAEERYEEYLHSSSQDIRDFR